MRRSKAEIYLHLVWATQDRQPLVTSVIRDRLYLFVEMQAKHIGCDVLGIGGMPDHVHLVVRIPTTVCVAQLMKLVKGSSSAFVNALTERTPYFRWQEGYGAFSLCRPLLPKVVAYVEHQERHHNIGPLWAEWEETNEKIPMQEAHPPRPQDASPSE